MLLEYCAYGDLNSFLMKRPELEWEQRLKLVSGAASGMEGLHQNQLCHRDLKTMNIMVDGGLNAKVRCHLNNPSKLNSSRYCCPPHLSLERC